MTNDESPERAIGRLEGKLDSAIDAIADSKKESSEGRARIYGELESIRRETAESRQEIADSKRSIQELQSKMKAAAPAIEEINRWKERFIGMRMLIVFGAATFGGFIVAGWKWIMVKLGMT